MFTLAELFGKNLNPNNLWFKNNLSYPYKTYDTNYKNLAGKIYKKAHKIILFNQDALRRMRSNF
ncbi:MAG: hypothetical protein BAJALOKI2v1_10057 [Promethearchaeota archaeon]|nr:MAG: hypothetical protein BAJALOKI2v1_10057 [Candidatus Lokiarchaeota archaeon]